MNWKQIMNQPLSQHEVAESCKLFDKRALRGPALVFGVAPFLSRLTTYHRTKRFDKTPATDRKQLSVRPSDVRLTYCISRIQIWDTLSIETIARWSCNRSKQYVFLYTALSMSSFFQNSFPFKYFIYLRVKCTKVK